MYKTFVTACLTIMWFQSAFAVPDTPSGDKTYNQKRAIDQVQKARSDARKLAADGSEAGIAKAVAIDEDQIEFMQRPDIRELGYGNYSLVDREVDLRLDLASLYARLHDKVHALDELDRIEIRANAAGISKMIKEKPEFAFLQQDPRFQAFLTKSETPKLIWQETAFSLDYKPQLTLPERIAGLSDFWARVRSGFVHFDNVPKLDWNQKYLEFLGRIEKSESTIDYYDTLMQFAPLLHDAHTNIYPPKELISHFYSYPPMRTELIEGRVIVTAVLNKQLAQTIHKGDEIVSVDGKEVHEYAKEHVLPYVSSSTPQDTDVRLYSYQLLFGDAKQPVNLKINTKEGSSKELTVARSGYHEADGTALPEFQSRHLAHNIIYLSLDEFENDDGVKAFEKLLPDIMKSDGLILDLRRNGGGSTKFGYDILSYLTEQPIPTEYSTYRIDDGYMQYVFSKEVFYRQPVTLVNTEKYTRSTHYSGRVAVLIGPKTFSAAEDFLVSFDTLKRGIMVGQASGGSTGQPLVFSLPGGGTARICAKDDRYPDGKKFVGIGIKPQIEVSETVDDYRAGRDAVLEAAIERLSQL